MLTQFRQIACALILVSLITIALADDKQPDGREYLRNACSNEPPPMPTEARDAWIRTCAEAKREALTAALLNIQKWCSGHGYKVSGIWQRRCHRSIAYYAATPAVRPEPDQYHFPRGTETFYEQRKRPTFKPGTPEHR